MVLPRVEVYFLCFLFKSPSAVSGALNAAPASGESVVLPVKVTPKNTQLTDRKQEVYKDRPRRGKRRALHAVRVVTVNEKEVRKKSTLVLFFVFVFCSPLHNKK